MQLLYIALSSLWFSSLWRTQALMSSPVVIICCRGIFLLFADDVLLVRANDKPNIVKCLSGSTIFIHVIVFLYFSTQNFTKYYFGFLCKQVLLRSTPTIGIQFPLESARAGCLHSVPIFFLSPFKKCIDKLAKDYIITHPHKLPISHY